jgi:hypothetical protein
MFLYSCEEKQSNNSFFEGNLMIMILWGFLASFRGIISPTGQRIPHYGLPQWVLPVLCIHRILFALY